MARAANQKLKILYILKLLEKSDETHAVTMRAILEELAAHGIQAERKRIYDDLDALRNFGYPIAAKRGRMAGYYLEGPAAPPAGEAGPGEAEAAGSGSGASGAEEAGSGTAGAGESGIAETVSAADSREEPARLSEAPEWLVHGDIRVELLCGEETAEAILESLGGKGSVRVKAGKKEGSVALRLKVIPGEGFFGWLAGFGCRVRLAEPAPVIKEYRRFLKGIRNLYKEG